MFSSGVSPIAATAMTGFSLILDPTDPAHIFSTSTQVNGKCYGASYGGMTASDLTIAINDRLTAYNDAHARGSGPAQDFVRYEAGVLVADSHYLNLESGNIAGQTLYPGVYQWGNVAITNSITIKGNPNDHFLLKAVGNVILSGGKQVRLTLPPPFPVPSPSYPTIQLAPPPHSVFPCRGPSWEEPPWNTTTTNQ